MTLKVASDDIFDEIVFDDKGLVVAVVQDVADRTVLMVAYMNQSSLRKTVETGRTWFWSRSRQELWCKGETSGDRQFVHSIDYDCDGDALLIIVEQQGKGACHTGERSCFFRVLATGQDAEERP